MTNNDKMNRLSGRYDIIEQVGIGGMSTVYKAFDTKKKRIVAIKILKDEFSLDDEFVKKFKTEALASKDIRHENVVAAYDVVDEDKMHYIVMEYIEGITLNKYIKQHGKLSNEETVNISLQIAKGIQAAHKKGIIHRDIKPQNIVINNKNIVKLTDFGIARAITSTTRNISVVGTVHYISPEQVRNDKVDFKSDIYSFGCTMYEMITGVVPFTGETPLEIVVSHLRENIKAPHIDNPQIYTSLEKIILKATRMIPRERYQCIEDMISDLEKALSDKEGSFIKDNVYDEDEEGKTVIISDEDMKVIKAVSEKLTNKNTYKEKDSKNDLTPEQKEFFERYIINGAYKQHLLIRRIIIGAILAVALLVIIMIFIALDTRKVEIHHISTNSVVNVIDNIVTSLNGIDVDLAKNLVSEYGVTINVVGEDYSDDVGYGKILKVENNNIDTTKTLDVIVSKGSFNIDFSDSAELQSIKWTDMIERLNDRGLTYKVSEINDMNVPRGYIIGVNKKNSSEPGELVFTISRGISDAIKTMPDLYGKNISEVRDLLSANELVLGNISFLRDYNIAENCVISQSIDSGKEVRAGTSIDLTLSCGKNGVEYIATDKPKWYSQLSSTYRVTKDNVPSVDGSTETIMIGVRLVQQTDKGTVYTELMEPQEYKIGTIIPLVFPTLVGEPEVQNGQVQVVDVVNDKVLNSIDVLFWPKQE